MFHFKVGRKDYTLPASTVGTAKMSGRDLRDAAMGGEAGQMAYMFKLLEASGPTKAALDALYDMPQTEMMDILSAWGDHKDEDSVSLGESSGSSV